MNKIYTGLIVSLILFVSANANKIEEPIFGYLIGKLVLDGTLSSGNLAAVSCRISFSGTGNVTAPLVFIKAKKFEFTGTIKCDESCTILVQEPFDTMMFKREGSGKFLIIVDPTITFE